MKLQVHMLKPGIRLTLLLVIMSSYPPLSTDMYLPAFPMITTQFSTSVSMMNLTLVLFFIFFSVATLVWGPISDKTGRKKAILTGVALYITASIGCLFSESISALIGFRILQAIGAGAPVTISLAIVQDIYTGEEKKKVFAVLSALMMVAPVVAPIMGSAILTFSSWRMVFIILAILGGISFLGGLFIPETHATRGSQSLIQSLSGIFSVMKHPFFRKGVFVFAMPALVVLGFVGGSSSILMVGFGISSSLFSIYFAGNALFSILGSLVYVPVSKRFSANIIITSAFIITITGGVATVLFGHIHPLIFMLGVTPITFLMALIRPLGMNMLMEDGAHDAGAASAVINFLFTFIGSVGMQIIALEWESRARIFGILAVFTGIFCITLWHLALGRRGK